MENTEMVSSCFALNCTERNESGTLYTFHCIPNNQVRAKEWLKVLGREDAAINKHTKVCSRHFAPECFIFGKITSLTPDAVPSLHLGTPLENPNIKVATPDAVPSLHLGTPLENPNIKVAEPKKRKRRDRRNRKPYFFSEYTEWDIKKSPHVALRAFRVAKQSIKYKMELLEALKRANAVLEKRLAEYVSKFQRIPKQLRHELGLDCCRMDDNDKFSPKLKTLLKEPEMEIDSVQVKEEPLSDSDKEPCLQDSDSDSSELMDQDEWIKSFQQDGFVRHRMASSGPCAIKNELTELTFQQDTPSPQTPDDEILGLPVLGLPMSLDESNNLPIFGLPTSSLARSADLPTDGPSPSTILDLLRSFVAKSTELPTDVQSTSTPAKPSHLQSSSGTILHRCDADRSISATSSTDSSTSIATQTPSELIGISTELRRSVATQTRAKRPPTIEELEKRPFDGFGRFVAERLNRLDVKRALSLQTIFGNLLYKVTMGEPIPRF